MVLVLRTISKEGVYRAHFIRKGTRWTQEKHYTFKNLTSTTYKNLLLLTIESKDNDYEGTIHFD